MTREQEIDAALWEAERSAILASQYRQSGFKTLAAVMRENADNARRWANERAKENE